MPFMMWVGSIEGICNAMHAWSQDEDRHFQGKG